MFAALALCAARALSGCGAQASHWSGFSGCRAGALGHGASAAVTPELEVTGSILRHTGLAAPWHVGSSRIRPWTCVALTGWQILQHWATGEAHSSAWKAWWSFIEASFWEIVEWHCEVALQSLVIFVTHAFLLWITDSHPGSGEREFFNSISEDEEQWQWSWELP